MRRICANLVLIVALVAVKIKFVRIVWKCVSVAVITIVIVEALIEAVNALCIGPGKMPMVVAVSTVSKRKGRSDHIYY